ncbi:hypothetical protein QBC42DRAFT_165321 [Cladorrhinum samala]|uniref:HypA-like protein n=1 Tax=Cladorrhinum samala TaxID=585594 RepID=A0AAV9I4T1_9PEZI|nr:hypothetical protein QBC42DRAFT_165321 [Cladorrhinum samala]
MHITPENTGLWGVTQTEEAAKTVTELLQKDLEKHHVFFNKDHFHNHIPHHLLALYGTKCTSPRLLQSAYQQNTYYQKPALPLHPSAFSVSPDDPWPSSASKYLGNEEFYPDFLRFFASELEAHGKQHVLQKYLFSDSQEMLVRLLGGFLHPLIQLMYGMEWDQPAIIAEALAQTAVHSDTLREFLHAAESRSRSRSRSGEGSSTTSSEAGGNRIVSLLDEIKSNEKLAAAARNSDSNKIHDGVLVRAKEEMLEMASRVRVAAEPQEIAEKTAEMFEACVYMASAAARHGKGKNDKYDFFLMHHVNSSPIFVTINKQDWISDETKARLLEWKIRMDLVQYAARGVPELGLDKLKEYKPRSPREGETLQDIISRLHSYGDDGHAIKLGRATVICRNICKKYEEEGKDWVQIRGEDLWKKICHLIVDSVESPGDTWVRSAGFEEAWKVY